MDGRLKLASQHAHIIFTKMCLQLLIRGTGAPVICQSKDKILMHRKERPALLQQFFYKLIQPKVTQQIRIFHDINTPCMHLRNK
jgi:hypothetical protein